MSLLRRQSQFVRNSFILRGKDQSSNTHEASKPSGATKFRKQKKGKGPEKGGITGGQQAHERAMEEWKRFAKVLRPELVRPERTSEELLEARKMVSMYAKRTFQLDKTFYREESKRMRLKELAIEELPEDLRAKALEPDTAPIPKHFIQTQRIPPKENENIFGTYQLPGQRLSIDGLGAAPSISRVPKR